MSGIAGLFYPRTPKPVEPSRLKAMADVLAHRGPDGAGTWFAPGIGLAHRRLASVDPSGQPVTNADGTAACVLDGAILDARDLREMLEAQGARFETASDAELLLHAWQAWGPDLLRRLNGGFAFALYDGARQCLFLARDRLGVKPLAYAGLSDGALAFASELKGLAAHPLFRCEADFRAVEDYLALGHVPDDTSLLAGARKLPAGHFLLVERGKPVPQPIRWWDVDFFTRSTGKARDLEAELLARMRQSVRAHMGPRTGALLDGGMDSGAVVALMAEASKKAVHTAADEQVGAAHVIALRFHTAHVSRALPADDFAVIDTIVQAFDEPFADAGALAAFRARQLARENMAVALSGEGADEILAGHRRYRVHLAEERVRRLSPLGLRGIVFGALGRVYPAAGALAMPGERAYPSLLAVTPPQARWRLYSEAAQRALGHYRAEQRYADAMRQAPARDALDRAQYADIKLALPGQVLAASDRIGAVAGLEVRAPLLDHRLVEFAATLPRELRVRSGQGKWLMKRAFAPYLPKEMLYRPAARPAPPVGAWFRGPLAEEAATLARSPLLEATGWFDLKAIERLAASHRASHADHGRTLWQLMMLDRSLKRLFG